VQASLCVGMLQSSRACVPGCVSACVEAWFRGKVQACSCAGVLSCRLACVEACLRVFMLECRRASCKRAFM
jgi:hypothetical protein